MLGTVLLLVLCTLAAIAGIPLILKLVPPNEIYGFRPEHTRWRPELWYAVNRFAGWALVAASACMVLALVVGPSALVHSLWAQLLLLIVLGALAFGSTLLYERELRQRRKSRAPRSPA